MVKKELIRTLDIIVVLVILGLLVILIIAFVLATITLLIFVFNGIIRRTHIIANKKSTQNTHNLQIQIISVKL